MTFKISLIFDTAQARDAFPATQALPASEPVSIHVGGARSLSAVMQKEQPDVVILALQAADENAFEQIEAATMRMPGVMVLLVSPDSDMATIKRAMRAGVREVLPAPIGRQTVQVAINCLKEAREIHARVVSNSGSMHAFVAAKGGSGCTFLVTNLAYLLSTRGKRVLLIDLNLYFGEAASYLSDSKAEASVVDLARQSRRLDASLLEASVLKTHERLHVLAAPDLPYQLESVTPETVAAVLGLACSEYDFVLLDLGRTMDPSMIRALDLSERIHLVMEQTLPALNDAKRMARVFAGLGYASEKVQLVLNRYAKSSPVPIGEVESATGHAVSRTVPGSGVPVLASINQGVPLVHLAPRDPVTRALQDWAQALSPSTLEPVRRRWFAAFAQGV
jgi:pilus assembly protein CpaE